MSPRSFRIQVKPLNQTKAVIKGLIKYYVEGKASFWLHAQKWRGHLTVFSGAENGRKREWVRKGY